MNFIFYMVFLKTNLFLLYHLFFLINLIQSFFIFRVFQSAYLTKEFYFQGTMVYRRVYPAYHLHKQPFYHFLHIRTRPATVLKPNQAVHNPFYLYILLLIFNILFIKPQIYMRYVSHIIYLLFIQLLNIFIYLYISLVFLHSFLLFI